MMDGNDLFSVVEELFPQMRSITGEGIRNSLSRLGDVAPLTIHEVPTGTQVLDWVVPQEWRFNEAFIESPTGERLVDTADSTLHVVNYSIGIQAELSGSELQEHLHSLADRPTAIPYRTAYYEPTWGFCLSENARAGLGEGPYRVVIDAEHFDGSLTYGELHIPGQVQDEILISTHICHPSLANDNLSGMAIAAALASELSSEPRHFSYRFVFVPGTIGAITWLSRNQSAVDHTKAALVLTGLGDASPFTWKRTVGGNDWIDRVVTHVLARSGLPHHIVDFSPYGYDERQYSSPGFRIPTGRLSRAVHGTFPEYHTSADNLEFIKPEYLEASLLLLRSIIESLDADATFVNLQPDGEPQLGRRGLYGAVGALANPGEAQMQMLWLLNQSDGEHSILDIAERADLDMADLSTMAQLLETNHLLKSIPDSVDSPMIPIKRANNQPTPTINAAEDQERT
jgi:aminopeptidase-like protein